MGTIVAADIDKDLGHHFMEAGEAWSLGDWGGVTAALEQASTSLDKYITTLSSATPSEQMWRTIQQELEDISTIEGCSSVGPPASIPNWISIQESLRSVAKASSIATVTTGEDDHDDDKARETIHKLYQAVKELIDSI
jgi:hypothetical protein